MNNFKIGDSVLFAKIENRHLCGYEARPYRIIGKIKAEVQTMFLISNIYNTFWTNEAAITKAVIIYEQMTLF